MSTRLNRWLPTAISLLALLVAVLALGVPSEAAAKINGRLIKKGTVASKQLKDGDITGIDLRDGSVTGADLTAGSVGTPQLGDGAVTAPKLARGAVDGLALDGAGTVQLDFPAMIGGVCYNASFSPAPGKVLDGSLSDDVIVATPDAFFGGQFSFSVKSDGPQTIIIKLCNISGTAADPDGGAGTKTWRWAAIDVL